LPQIDLLHFEMAAFRQNKMRVAGVDEAGRGPLAGPVVAAAVQFPKELLENLSRGFLSKEDSLLLEINDSKKVAPKKREKIFAYLMESLPIKKAISVVSAQKIDEINILNATGYAESPLLHLYFLMIVLCAFYFRGVALITAMFLCMCGYYLSQAPIFDALFIRADSVVSLCIFISIAYAAHYLDMRLSQYQRIACEAYEELISQREKIYKAKRFESVVETIGSLSHQLSQPLTIALGKTQLALKNIEQAPPTKEELEKIVQELEIAKNLLHKFREIKEYSTEEYVQGEKILKVSPKKQDSPEQD